jgi:putative NIF3 family GTP cyclohydrolase 1 type 2
MSMRNNVLLAAVSSLILIFGFVCALSGPVHAQTQPAPLTAGEAIARIEQATGATAPANTVDTIKAGDANTEVTGVVVTFMDTYAVLQHAVELGANLIITHEPTFYNHPDDLNQLADDRVTAEKLAYIRTHKLVVWRFHDTWHLRQPDGILEGEVKALGWEVYQDAGNPHLFHLPQTTVGGLAKEVERKLGSHAVQVVGDRAMKVRTVGLLPGASGLQKQTKLLSLDGVDALVAGESAQWEGVAWTLDAAAEGHNKALLLVGHEASEEAGMKWCAEWLRTVLPGEKILWIPAGEPWAK